MKTGKQDVDDSLKIEIRARRKDSHDEYRTWLVVTPMGGRDAHSIARVIVAGMSYYIPHVEFGLFRNGAPIDAWVQGRSARVKAG